MVKMSTKGSRQATRMSKRRLLLEALELRLPPGDAVFAGLLPEGLNFIP